MPKPQFQGLVVDRVLAHQGEWLILLFERSLGAGNSVALVATFDIVVYVDVLLDNPRGKVAYLSRGPKEKVVPKIIRYANDATERLMIEHFPEQYGKANSFAPLEHQIMMKSEDVIRSFVLGMLQSTVRLEID